MKLEEKKFKGIWWFNEEKYDGELTIISNENIILSLGNWLNKKDGKIEFIYGETVFKEKITLYKCHVSSRGEKNVKNVSVHNTIINCEYAVVGEYYDKENFKFNNLYVRYSNLEDWLDNKIIVKDNEEENLFNISYSNIFKKINLIGVEISLTSSWNQNFTGNNNVNIKKYAQVIFTFLEKKDLSFCEDYLNSFNDFLILATQKPIIILEVCEVLNPLDFIYIYKSHSRGNIYSKEINWHEMLFTYNDVKDDLELYLNNFFEKKSFLKKIFSIYSGTILNQNYYIENLFLTFCRLLESFHRYDTQFDSTDLDSFEFEGRKKIVLDRINSDDSIDINIKDWVSDLIGRYGNSKSIKKIFSELIGNVEEILIQKTSKEELINFITLVTKTRHYLTHPGDPKRGNFDYLKHIVPLTYKLEIILICNILKEIEFTTKKIVEMFLTRTELRYFFKDVKWSF